MNALFNTPSHIIFTPFAPMPVRPARDEPLPVPFFRRIKMTKASFKDVSSAKPTKTSSSQYSKSVESSQTDVKEKALKRERRSVSNCSSLDMRELEGAYWENAAKKMGI
ncbi:hypothetical protein [Phaffia rhodozyma]|uniref:Uncharacterized protein n=1 Tax=Phaffia rhodozyma TaxID=264483 RepID=A0A0F7SWJ6_PHARH|nr:hypothetical protein [Phaffia rhodozyma]